MITETMLVKPLERAMGLEPTTFCMASRRSTTELRPLNLISETPFNPSRTIKNCQ
jgi:hypothetical protein